MGGRVGIFMNQIAFYYLYNCSAFVWCGQLHNKLQLTVGCIHVINLRGKKQRKKYSGKKKMTRKSE